jgi:hypothetical protein
MGEETFDISLLQTDDSLVAGAVSSTQLFGVFRRALKVPSGWVALVIGHEGDRSTVASGDEIAATDTAEAVFVRAEALLLEFDVGTVSSSDEYLCEASAALSIEVSDKASDLAAFRSAVMGPARQIELSTVCDYLQDDVRRTLVTWARERDATRLVDGRDADALETAIRDGVGPACFSAGLKPVGEVSATFRSAALDAVRAEAERGAVQRDRLALDQQLRQAADAARREHLEHVGEMLARLEEMALRSPDVSVIDLIRQFGEDQRGQLYRSLLRSRLDAAQDQTLVVAAGEELIWLDANAPERPIRRLRADVPGGAVRSVHVLTDGDGRVMLAVGATAAVALLDPSSGQMQATLNWDVPSDTTVRRGVNALAVSGRMLLATHSDLGVRCWSLDTPHESLPLLTNVTGPARTVRHVKTDASGQVWLSVDDVVLCLAGEDLAAAVPTQYTGSTAEVTALAVTDHEIYAGNADGQVVRWPMGQPNTCDVVYRGGASPCRSVHVGAVMGIHRLGVTDGSDAVKEVVLGDTVVERYLAGGDRLRQAWWLDSRIVAVNDQRTRLYVWSVGRPASPTGTTDVGWLCSNRVQDVCPVAAPDGGGAGPVAQG